MPHRPLLAFDAGGACLLASPAATEAGIRCADTPLPESIRTRLAKGHEGVLIETWPDLALHPSGLWRFWSLPGPDGRPSGFLAAPGPAEGPIPPGRDAELDASRWRYLLDEAPDGFWDWSLVTGQVLYAARFQTMLGYPAGSFAPEVSEWAGRLHADDREPAFAALRNHIAGHAPTFSIEHRLRSADGHWLWTLSFGRIVERDDQGQPVRMMGTITDISAYKALEGQLREREALLLEAQRVGDIGSWSYDPERDMSWWSERMYHIYGLPVDCEQRHREAHLDMYTPESRHRLDAAIERALHSGEPYSLDLEFIRPDGERRWISARSERVFDHVGNPRLVGVVQDITSRRQRDSELRRQAGLLTEMSRMGRIGGFEWDLRDNTLSWTEEVYRLHHIEPGTRIDPDSVHALYDGDSQARLNVIYARLRAGDSDYESAELCLFTPEGRRVWLRFQARSERENGEVVRIAGVQQDVTAEREAADLIEQLAHFDGLTGLPNRFLFRQRAQAAIREAQAHGRMLALLFIDLDRFKNVNDSLGHGAGDNLLFQMAGRLRGCVRSSDVIGRHSGDEFLALLNPISRAEDAARVAKKILETVSVPVELQEGHLQVGCSIGIAVLNGDGGDLDGLLRAADTAMYAAKDSGRNTYTFYSEEFRDRVQRRITLESQLRQAIVRDELHLVYQPTVYSQSGAVAGIEALLRWTSETGELRSPQEFIPIAEDCGEIVSIGYWVLRQSVRQARAWHQDGLNFQRIAVNVSAVQLREPDFGQNVVDICREEDWPTHRLQLELTESALMRDSETLVRAFELFEREGISLAVDDFGTGFSNLNYLTRFPVRVLKIDRSFTENILDDIGKFELCRAIIGLGHALDLQVVAEGVESLAVHELLRNQGCDESQGYFIARPLAADAMAEWLRGHD
ncbi:MAG TPA: histidine kinase [Xanthomonadales bacterium]|nr:histidine kinase [Xanthomonadales bacterium]